MEERTDHEFHPGLRVTRPLLCGVKPVVPRMTEPLNMALTSRSGSLQDSFTPYTVGSSTGHDLKMQPHVDATHQHHLLALNTDLQDTCIPSRS
jgi:hypothetical protein